MTRQQAVEIINKTRISNPFTMSLEFEQYIKTFRKRYATIYGEIIPNDVILIAKILKNYEQ